MRSRSTLLLALVAAAIALAGPARAAAPDDRVLSADQYTTEKARTLGRSHAAALRDLNTSIYHCMPWVEVQKQSIGFFKPKQAQRDDRYLSIRIYIEQDPSEQFAKLGIEQRASAMFSRYAGPMLRRMAKPALMADTAVDGFTVVLEWLKQAPTAAMARPVHETIAAFFEKPVVAEYLAGRLHATDLAARASVLGWDGETPLGSLRVAAWDDDFVSTYKIKNYVLDPGVKCQ